MRASHACPLLVIGTTRANGLPRVRSWYTGQLQPAVSMFAWTTCASAAIDALPAIQRRYGRLLTHA